MTQPKQKPEVEAKASTEVLPSHAHARAGEETLTDAEVSAANAAYQVRFKPVGDLTPYARNARTHSDEQVAQIAASIIEFGFVGAVIADEKGIVAGHGRVMAATKLYGQGKRLKAPNGTLIPKGCVPWVDCTGWSEAQRKAYILTDNQLALNAGWNADLLKLEVQELQAMDFNLDLIGFDTNVLDGLLAPEGSEGLTDPDETPEAPSEPVTRPGDVWLLGRHRIICGDSTVATDVERVMAGHVADLCFTSPPYAQQRDYKQEISDWDALMSGVFALVPVKAGAQILVNLGLVHEGGRVDQYWDKWIDFMESAGWPLFGWYVWDKGFGLPGNWNGRLAPAHEFVFHFSKGGNKPANKWVDKKPENVGKASHGTGLRRKDGTMSGMSSPQSAAQPTKIADSVIRVSPQMARNGDTSHPAMFPVALCEYIYNSYAKAGDWVFEPFSGSGTSIIACEKLGMHCAAIELAPAYTDVAVTRWEKFTGQAAILEATGQTFAELLAERGKPGDVQVRVAPTKKPEKAA